MTKRRAEQEAAWREYVAALAKDAHGKRHDAFNEAITGNTPRHIGEPLGLVMRRLAKEEER